MPFSRDVLDYMASVAKIHSYFRGKQFYLEGGKSPSVFIVLSGYLKLYKTNQKGHEQIYRVLSEGDVFGNIGKEEVLQYSARALTGGVLYEFDKSVFFDTTRESTNFKNEVFVRMSKMKAAEYGRRRRLMRCSVPQRLAAYLLTLRPKTSDDEIIKIPLNRNEMGGYLGASSESISRTFTKFYEQGLIEKRGPGSRYISLKNIVGLRRLANI